MLPPHIVEREARKTLSLLGYALERSDVATASWTAAVDRAGIGPVDDCVCLFGENGEWLVTYTERGGWRDIGRFPACYDAANFLYSYLVRGKSPYDYRKEWEAHTGQQFSMIE
jgi:hypothetical protein